MTGIPHFHPAQAAGPLPMARALRAGSVAPPGAAEPAATPSAPWLAPKTTQRKCKPSIEELLLPHLQRGWVLQDVAEHSSNEGLQLGLEDGGGQVQQGGVAPRREHLQAKDAGRASGAAWTG